MTYPGDEESIIGASTATDSKPPCSYLPTNPRFHPEVMELTLQAQENPELWYRIPHLVIGLYGWDEKKAKKWFGYYRQGEVEKAKIKKVVPKKDSVRAEVKSSSNTEGNHSLRSSLLIATTTFMMVSVFLYLWLSRNDDLRVKQNAPPIPFQEKLVESLVLALGISIGVLIFCYLIQSRVNKTSPKEEKQP